MNNNNKYWMAFLVLVAIFAIVPLTESAGAFSWSSVRYTYSDSTSPSLAPRGTSQINYCFGNSYCSGVSQSKCISAPGCYWGGSTCKGTAPACDARTTQWQCEVVPGCNWSWTYIDSCKAKTVTLDVGEETTFCCSHVVKLKNVGSATTNTPIIIEVTSPKKYITETVTGTEDVNGVGIKVVSTKYADNTADRQATITLIPNF